MMRLIDLTLSILLAWPASAQYVATVPATPTSAAGNTITFVEAVGNTSANSTAAYNVTVTSTATHDALFIGVWDQTATASCAAGSAQPAISFNQTATATLQAQTATAIGTHYCWYVYSLLNTPAAITTVTTQLGSGDTFGGTIVFHFSSSGAWTGIDQTQAITTTSQGTPWASAGVTTTHTHEVLIGFVGITLTTYNSSLQNAIAPTGSWTDYAICSQSSTSPCLTTVNSSGNLDGASGGILGFGYQIVTSTQAGIAFTGTNNGTTNVYANYPDITTYY